MDVIKSVAWLHAKSGEVLCVRTKGKDKFYIPGGKIEQGEQPEEALAREIKEELGLIIDKGSIVPATIITAEAHGVNSHVLVEMQCFFAEYEGAISANAEIAEIKWMGADYQALCAPAAQRAIEFLKDKKKV